VTDKPPEKQPEYEVSLIRNVDRDLSKIGRVHKQNSGQYEALIRTAKNNRTPLCLENYGVILKPVSSKILLVSRSFRQTTIMIA
jgi:hypothetical protein